MNEPRSVVGSSVTSRQSPVIRLRRS
jgi:hypothetical protein